jgi:PAS domain S-box-containing protein
MRTIPFRAVIGLMIVSMALVAALVTAVTILLLYRTAHDQELTEMQGAAETLAGLAEAVAQFDLKYSASDNPDGSWGATMSQVEQGLVGPNARRPSEELIIGRRVDARIQVMRRSPTSGAVEDVLTLDPASARAQPLRRALEGQHGSGELIDYAGTSVLAGYAYVPSLDVAVVYKVDLAEVRAPYIRAAAWSGLVALAAIVIGAASFVLFARPLRRQAEQPERRLQSLIAAAPVGVYETDARGHCTFVNEQWCALTGLRPEQAFGGGWAGALHPEDRAAVGAAWEEFVAGRAPFAMEYRFQSPQGGTAWVYGQASPIPGRDGKAVGYTGTVTDITDRRKADDAVRTSERRLRSIIDGMFAYVALYSPDGVMLEANQHTLDQWRLRREQMIGRRPWETERWANDPKTAELLKRTYARAAKGESVRGDITATVADSLRITTDSTLQPLFDEDGNVTMLLSFAVDITERKQAEEALRKSEARLAEAQRLAHLGYWELDLATNQVWWSEEQYAVNGLPISAEPVSQDLFVNLLHPDDRGWFLKMMEDVIAGPGHGSGEYRIVRPDGATRTIYGQCEVLFDPDGRPLRMSGTNQDITDRRRAEEALRASETKYRELIEQASDGIFLADSSGRYVDVNEAACSMLGYTREELLGLRILDVLVVVDEADQVRQSEALDRGEPVQSERLHRRKDGTLFPVEVSARRQFDGLFQAIVRDITQRKRAEDEISRALQEKETLLKEVHHRVKNNLAVVVELLTMQSHQVADPASRLALAESVNRVYAISLVHELIYQSASLSSIDFGEHIGRLSEKLLETYEVPGSRVALRTEAGKVAVTIDQAVPCSLILNELVTNALKHAFPGGSEGLIEVTLRHDGADHVLLEVRDNGAGMPPGIDVNTSRSLGLRLVSSLARQLGGSVEIVRGPGTAFRIRFPARSPQFQETPVSPA